MLVMSIVITIIIITIIIIMIVVTSHITVFVGSKLTWHCTNDNV